MPQFITGRRKCQGLESKDIEYLKGSRFYIILWFSRLSQSLLLPFLRGPQGHTGYTIFS